MSRRCMRSWSGHRPGSWLVAVIVATAAPGFSQSQEQPTRAIPKVGGLVRVVAPKLGSEWHVGMFNRIRVEPPCYVVFLFTTDGNYQLRETLSLAELEQLQVHRMYGDQSPPEETWREVAGAEYWLAAPLDSLKNVNVRQCPPSPSR